MTKKKTNRPKHQKDASLCDTSEEESIASIQGKSCPHVARGIHFGRVKKSLKSSQSIIVCNGCDNENNEEELPEVWLCLQCGYRGCGRMSENKHGLQHFKTLHSDCHSLVLSTTSSVVWCYDCDEEISLQSSRILKQCVEFVMKMAPNASEKPNVSNFSKFTAQNSLQNSVIKEEPAMQVPETNGPVEKAKKPVKSNKEITAKISIKGLRNLGNTCFFNAVMQNLNQTSLLYHELKNTCNPSCSWEVPELFFSNSEVTENENLNTFKLSLPRQFPLTNCLLNFLEQMSAASNAKVEIINPSSLFGEISKKCPRFRHFQQQDSHELLRQLLDGIRQEEIKRQKKAILRHFDLENVNPEEVDEDMKKEIKAYGIYASHTIVEKIFGGLLISTVLCEECKMSSQVFEPFMDLSLPLFEEKQQENNEQLNAMLDGGKQDHIKPLRNKKSEWDSDDNDQGNYVLSKPKVHDGKPSKHQEKKQKQMAKKEKKRAKIVARNRKSSLNEQDDDLASNQLPEADEDGANEPKEDSKDLGDSGIENQDEEIWEMTPLLDTGEDNSKMDVESNTLTHHPHPEFLGESDLAKEAVHNSNSPLQKHDKNIGNEVLTLNNESIVNGDRDTTDLTHDFNTIRNQIAVNNSTTVIKADEDKEFVDNQVTENNTELNDFGLKYENQNKVSDPVSQIQGNFQSHVESKDSLLKDVSSCINNECVLPTADSPNPIQSNSHMTGTVLSNSQMDSGDGSMLTSDPTENVLHLPKAQTDVKREEKEICSENFEKSVNSNLSNCCTITSEMDTKDVSTILKEETKDKDTNPDSSFEGFSEHFNNQLKIHETSIDDRMQELSRQITDVRIRRDSDRQENLLNSSESADDYESQKTNCTSPKSSIEDTCSVENGDNWSHSVSEQQTKDWISKTLTTLKPRHHVSPLECSINSCLSHFTKPELLYGNNKFRCENCTEIKIKKTGNKKDIVYTNASKQLLIFSPPAILTLHLKRFQQVGMSLRKVNRFVEFPLLLDLAPFCCAASTILPHMSSVEDEILYSLYGIVEHSGRLTSGHYTAYVKANKRTVNKTFECELPLSQCNFQQLLHKFCGASKQSTPGVSDDTNEIRQWFYISDSHVKEVSESQVLKCQAYLLFYERIK